VSAARGKNRKGFLPRRLRPTREGWWFLVGTLLIGLAAVNAGLNLLFAVFGMMLFVILASGIMSELCLRDLHVVRKPPQTAHANTPFLMGISVRNKKRQVPSFSLEVEDLTARFPVERRCHFLKIPAGRIQETAYRQRIDSRGVHRLVGFRLSTRFPFGLIRKSRNIESPLNLVVYPKLVPVQQHLAAAGFDQQRLEGQLRANRSGDFRGLRDYRQGDDPRQIHWRSSAKRGRLLIREAERAAGKRVCIVLQNEPQQHTQAQGKPGQDKPDSNDINEAFERAVCVAASLCVTLLQQGYEVGFWAGDEFIEPQATPPQRERILRACALVEPASKRPAQADLSERQTPLPVAVATTLAIYVTPDASGPPLVRSNKTLAGAA